MKMDSAMLLLDTNILSETRKNRPHGGVMQFLAACGEEELHLSAVSIGEIQAGIELTRYAMIAATAKVHRLTVLTRNVVDFECFSVPTLNPFLAQR